MRIPITISAGVAALAVPAVAAAAITPPAGVSVQVVARNVPQPTAIAFDGAGGMWVTSAGNVTSPRDGVWYVPRPGATPRHVVKGLFLALGLAWRDGVLYVSHVTPFDASVAPLNRKGRVVGFTGWNGSRFRGSRTVLSDLPVGLHTMDNIVVGPDRRLYVGIGSRRDTARGPSPLSATVVSVDPDVAKPVARVEARGLRNPYGLAFIPGTSDLVVTDNGRDDLGDGRPPDEVNVVRTGGPALNYGFPGCWGQGGAPCRGTVGALVKTAPHASTDGVAVAERFGSYGLSAFIANNGSSLFENPATTNVQRVEITRTPTGYRGRLRPFATGFRRFDPLGAAMGPDGGLYVTLWLSGQVVRFRPR